MDIPASEIINYCWSKGELSYKLWDQQLPIYKSIRENQGHLSVVLCARQFGKSHLGVLMALEDCLRYPDHCILIIGPTLKQTTDIVAPRLKAIAKDAPPGLIRRSKSESKWYIGPVSQESELVIGGFDVDSGSQRGKTVQNIYIEEIVDAAEDKYLESMRSDLGPALTHSDNGKLVFLTTLPKTPDHPFIIDTIVEAEMHDSLYKFTINDNKKLTKEQYDRCVARSGGLHSVDFRREYLCEVVRDDNLVVVPTYDEEKHVGNFEYPLGLNHQVTIDWGGVRDKTVALFHCYDFEHDRDLIYHEYKFEPNTQTGQITGTIKYLMNQIKYVKEWRVVADVPGQVRVDLNSMHKFNVTLPPKNDWQAGVNGMVVRFANDKVLIHENCKFLRQSLRSGTFNKHKTDFERTTALGHCDALAALMYAVRSKNQKNPFDSHNPPKDLYMSLPKEDENEKMHDKVSGKNFMHKYGYRPARLNRSGLLKRKH